MARVVLDHQFFTDPRIAELARLAGEGLLLTHGRLLEVYRYCYDQADSVIKDRRMIAILCETDADYASLMCQSGLLKELQNGAVKVRGVDERIAYIKEARNRAKLGGTKKGQNHRKRIKNQEVTDIANAINQGAIKPTLTLTLTPTLTPTPKEIKIHSSARAYSLLALWNSMNMPGKKCESTLRREMLAQERWNEKPDENYWREVMGKILASDFLTGKGSGGFKATFDWLLKDDNHVKVNEDQYANGSPTKGIISDWVPPEKRNR